MPPAPPGTRVKNTFIDVDEDVPAPPVDLRRARSEMVASSHVELGGPGAEEDDNFSTAPTTSSVAAMPSTGLFQGVVVKNTFIDFPSPEDDLPPGVGGPLLRAQTHTGAPDRTQESDSDDPPEARLGTHPEEVDVDEVEDVVGEMGEFGEFDGDTTGDAPPPPMSLDIGRAVTYNQTEEGSYWSSWQNQQPQTPMPPIPQQVQQVLATPPQQMQPGQQGAPAMYTMVPVMMPPQNFGGNLPADESGGAPPSNPAPRLGRVDTPGEPPAGLPSGGLVSDLEPSLELRPGSEIPVKPLLERVESATNPALQRIRWRVDERKLKSTDREHVSPVFQVNFPAGRKVQFKIVIRPKAVTETRGGASFKKAKGKGSVELRCLERLEPGANPKVTFRIAVSPDGLQADYRQPIDHDFSQRSICGLPRDQDEWDFQRDVKDAAFFVCIEITTGGLR